MAAASAPRSFRLSPEDDSRLDSIAAARFGGRRSEAVRAAIEIAAAVYASSAARAEPDPTSALAAYVRSRRG